MVTDQHQENVYQSRQRAFFIDLAVNRANKNKKAMYFTEAMKFLTFRPQHFVMRAQASVCEKLLFIAPR